MNAPKPPEGGSDLDHDQEIQDQDTWVKESLAIARELIRAGCPVRSAKRAMRKTEGGKRKWDATGGTGGTGYWLPSGWEQTEASEAWLKHWEPGDALFMVTGHAADLLDCDPRHGGNETVATLQAEGKMPKGTGRQVTPSGGWHTLIAPLGLGSDNGARPGVDIKSGQPDGEGRGFGFIAPTVRVSKTTGKDDWYRWTERPDVASLKGDRSGEALATEIRERRAGGTAARADPLRWQTDGEPTERVQAKLDAYHANVTNGRARHDSARDTVLALVRYGEQGDTGTARAVEELHQAFLIDLDGEHGRDPEQEWTNLLRGAVAKVAASRSEQTPEQEAGPLFISGEAFLDLADADTRPAWGDSDVCLWMPGESLMLVGPPGVGKTTMEHLLVWARLGLLDDVLGWSVVATDGKILYLAMDRPLQIARGMRRLLHPEHREIMRERLIVRRGPLPVDICQETTWLRDRAGEAGAGLIVVDSLKDVLPDPSDEKRAGYYNQARQHALAAGIEWHELHHNRKAGVGNKEPNTLDDVYGSRWLTAGAGSVLSLYGEAGDSVVSLKQLKSPAGELFPRWVQIDKDTGQISLHENVTVESLIAKARGGTSARFIARRVYDTEKPNRAQIQAVRNKLKRLAEQGLAEEYASPVDKSQMFRAAGNNGPRKQQRPSNARNVAPATRPATAATEGAKPQVNDGNAESNESNAPDPEQQRSGVVLYNPDVAPGAEEDHPRTLLAAVEEQIRDLAPEIQPRPFEQPDQEGAA